MSGATRDARRAFLKQSAAVAGGALAGALGIARAAYANGSDLLKVALIGAGGRGTGAAANCLEAGENIKLVAVADLFVKRIESSLAALRKQYGATRIDVSPERTFVGFDAYRKVIESGPDLVILATPPGFHPMHFQEAVRAGKHVFMEKPCCIDAPGYRSIEESGRVADSKGLKVGTGYCWRHDAGVAETIRRVREGAIGEVRSLEAFYQTAPFFNRVRESGQAEMSWQVSNWYQFVWLSGDCITVLLDHRLDVSNWIKDSHPVRARGSGGRKERSGGKYGDVFDHFELEYAYGDGTRLLAHASTLAQGLKKVADLATGSSGTASIIDATISGQTNWKYAGIKGNMYQQQFNALVAAIRNDEKYNEGPQGATSSMTAILGRMAAYEQREVTWEEAVRSKETYAPQVYSFAADPPTLPDKFGDYRVPARGRIVS